MGKYLKWIEILVLIVALFVVMEFLFQPIRTVLAGNPGWWKGLFPCLLPFVAFIILLFGGDEDPDRSVKDIRIAEKSRRDR